mgnify:CR=1 FL=1
MRNLLRADSTPHSRLSAPNRSILRPWPSLGAQALHVLPLLLVAQVASLAVRMWVGGNWPGFVYFAESLVGTAIWPVISWMLLAPQRRPTERDDTRPL